jgi:enoyl-CoA hydratase
VASQVEAAVVVVTEDGPVWTIRLNRPERLNALNPEAIALFREGMIRFRDCAAARVCILTGTGPRSFCREQTYVTRCRLAHVRTLKEAT